MSSIYEVIKAIHQAAADAKDHPYGGKKTGVLKREEGDFILDSRSTDGFGVSILGNMLTIKYQSECKISDTREASFETDIETILQGIVTYLKKEFKSATSETLTLKMVGESNIKVESFNNKRGSVYASCQYEIGNIKPLKTDIKQTGYTKAIDKMLKETNNDPYWVFKKFLND